MKINYITKKIVFNLKDRVKINWSVVYSDEDKYRHYNLNVIDYTQRDEVSFTIDQLKPNNRIFKGIGMESENKRGHWILPREILIKINKT